MFGLIIGLILHVGAGESIGNAVEMARHAYVQQGETTTILIAPGDYEEELTIDVPGLRLVNAAAEPSIGVTDGGVGIDENAVRITWYYGHGYQYTSMREQFNYGGKRARRWNASVLVTAPGFYAENIIFQNSFNLYVSVGEAADSLVDVTIWAERKEKETYPSAQKGTSPTLGEELKKPIWTANERPKRVMPERPKEVGNTEVQKRYFRERASALSFTSEAKDCVLRNCRVVGRQDALYGDHGASVVIEGGVLAGAVDYIFGGMTLTVTEAELVAMVGDEKNDVCYISAGRAATPANLATLSAEVRDSVPKDEIVEHGMIFVDCTVRHATAEELMNPGNAPVYLGRPWRWWGETVFVGVRAAEGVLAEEKWSLGLTKGHAAPFAITRESPTNHP